MAKVAMVVTNGHPPDPRVHKEALALCQAGHEVIVHAFDRLEELPEDSDDLSGVPYTLKRHRVGHTPFGGTSATLWGIRRFHRSVNKSLAESMPDVVHCHDADTLEVGLKAKSSYGAKVVFDMHDLAHTWAVMPNPRSSLRRLVSRSMCSRMLKRARQVDLVITCSGRLKEGGYPGFKEWLSERGIESRVIMNHPLSTPGTKECPLTPTLGFIGRVRDLASFDLLAKALESLPPEKRPNLRIAGDGVAHENVRKRFQSLMDDGMTIRMSGGFSLSELSDLIGEVSFMYCLYDPRRGNINEGAIPVKMLDAAQHGRSVICNSGCLMEDLLETKGFNGRAIPWGDTRALAECIVEMCAVDTLCDPPAEPLKSWNDEVKHLIEAYNGL